MLFRSLTGKLEALSPIKILDRGYALVFDSNGVLIKDSAHVTRGDQVSVRVSNGTFKAEVTEKS